MSTPIKALLPYAHRPLLAIRVGDEAPRPGVWEGFLHAIQENRACCDEVWFSTGIGLPLLEKHRENSRRIAQCARQLRELGIIPSIEIQATIGHGDGFLEPEDIPARAWGGFTGADGTQCRCCSCPRQPAFLQYFGEVAKIYAQWQPGSMWIDDDCRLGNHYPVMENGGCYCPDCLAAFSREEGRQWTREALAEACRNDPALWERWRAFGARSLAQLASVIVRSAHEVSPDTVFGLQHNDDPVCGAVMRALAEASGRRACSRPGGGAYSDHNPYAIINKGFNFSRQISDQPGYDVLGRICAEIETCPSVFCCKTPQGLRLESLLYLSLGCDSLSFFLSRIPGESPEWYGRELLAPLAADAPCLRDYARYNLGTMPGGVGMPEKEWWPEKNGLPLIGVPAGGHSPFALGQIITGEVAQNASEEELARLLSGDIIIDGKAAFALQKRGLSALIGGMTVERLEGNAREHCTDDPMNHGFAGAAIRQLYEEKYRFALPEGGNARVIGEYRNTSGKSLGAASLLLERPDGTRIAAFGYGGNNTEYAATYRVRSLVRAADWITHGRLPVLPDDPCQLLIIPRVDECGTLRSFTVANTVIGVQKPCRFRLRHLPPATTSAQWCVPSHDPVPLKLQPGDNGEATLTLPEIAPWDLGWVKFN